ncbi:hypothetical protein FQA39_LY07052 [Lamprigera yunnana]|nr:hypothetical protein FQA39_LY07052 [Lamprigera yunnana]
MDSIERLMRAAKPMPPALAGGNSLPRRALVHASLATTAAVSRRGRHLTGTFCLTGDTMEGIIQCLVFLKAFSGDLNVSLPLITLKTPEIVINESSKIEEELIEETSTEKY